jgi:internalin A
MSAPLTRISFIACLLAIACEQPPKPTAQKPSAVPVVTAAPAPSQAVSADPPKPKRAKKKPDDCPKVEAVSFSTPEFEEAVRTKLDKRTGAVTRADLGRLKSLNLTQRKLAERDVCLFPHMKNWKELFLGPGDLDDLGPIAELTKLESLRASMNQVSDLTPLGKMTKLDRVDLAHTQVRDLGPLVGASGLTELLLDNTPVEDVGPLAKLAKLKVLVLKDTRVKDLGPLRELKELKTLDIRGAPVKDTSPVDRLTGRGLKVSDL